MKRTYLDWNATTPPCDEAWGAMEAARRVGWANPASVHGDGRAARAVVEQGRAAVASWAGAHPRDVVFTSGGTEANNMALHAACGRGPTTLVVSRMEHPSVRVVAEALAATGAVELSWIASAPEGRIDVDDLLARVARAQTQYVVVALQAVNQETGVRMDVERACRELAGRDVWIHVDAVQAAGRVDVDLTGATTVSVAAHKLRGPKGIGALVMVRPVALTPRQLGGAQERGLRAGTLDPVAAAGFGAAVDRARVAALRWAALAPLRDRLERFVLERAPGAYVVAPAHRLPHVSSLVIPGWRGAELVAALDLEGVSISSGSACSAGTIEPSPVVRELCGHEAAASAVRISLGEDTCEGDIDRACDAFARVL